MLAKISDSKIVEWHSTDQESLFEKNLKISTSDWVYRSKKIYYNFNSQGYRCPEWTDISWEDSIVLIGCSYTAGIGLAEEDTLAAKLSAFTGKNVVNLGVSSSSNHLMLHNSFKLIDNNIKPSQVVVLFSDVSRVTQFNKDSHVNHYGAWIHPTHSHHSADSKLTMPQFGGQTLNFYSHWIRNDNSDVHGTMAARSVENLWKCHGVKFLGCFGGFDGQLNDRYYKLPRIVDTARDLMHPGIVTIHEWARSIADRI